MGGRLGWKAFPGDVVANAFSSGCSILLDIEAPPHALVVGVALGLRLGRPCTIATLLALITPWPFFVPITVTITPLCRSLIEKVC